MNHSDRAIRLLISRYFDVVVRDYNCGDVKWFLKHRSPTIGPLVACVGSGFDTVGGMLFGFKKSNSRERSVRFMVDCVGLPDIIAEAIYRCARCGYLHEGIGKSSLSWFADYDRITSGSVIFRREDSGLALNVVELAHKYLDAVEHIWKNEKDRLCHLPSKYSEDDAAIESLSNVDLPSLESVMRWHHNRLDRIRGSHSCQEILKEIRYWGHDGYAFCWDDERRRAEDGY